MIILYLISIIINHIYLLNEKEKKSSIIVDNYNILKLYDNNSNNTQNNSKIFGIIEIPKINIYYPVYSFLTEESLKILPCKFYGNTPKVNGNICIAGHNYNNSMFFSNISLLNTNDKIYIYDNSNHKYIYKVIDIYEVKESNLSPIFNYDKNSKELTLITCNNLNNNRIIVKSKQ